MCARSAYRMLNQITYRRTFFFSGYVYKCMFKFRYIKLMEIKWLEILNIEMSFEVSVIQVNYIWNWIFCLEYSKADAPEAVFIDLIRNIGALIIEINCLRSDNPLSTKRIYSIPISLRREKKFFRKKKTLM